jgi:hypothetical protein
VAIISLLPTMTITGFKNEKSPLDRWAFSETLSYVRGGRFAPTIPSASDLIIRKNKNVVNATAHSLPRQGRDSDRAGVGDWHDAGADWGGGFASFDAASGRSNLSIFD